jgi:hypothetical protein
MSVRKPALSPEEAQHTLLFVRYVVELVMKMSGEALVTLYHFMPTGLPHDKVLREIVESQLVQRNILTFVNEKLVWNVPDETHNTLVDHFGAAASIEDEFFSNVLNIGNPHKQVWEDEAYDLGETAALVEADGD